MRKRSIDNTGLSLVEVLVAMVVLLIGILAVIKIFPVGLSNIEKTRYNEIAERFVDGHIDELSAWNFDDLPVSIPEADQVPDGSRTEFSIRGVDIFFNEVGILEKADKDSLIGKDAKDANGLFAAVQCNEDFYTDQELSFTATTPPDAGSVARISLRNKAWSERIRNNPVEGYLDGLPDGKEDIHIYYANGKFGDESDPVKPIYGAPNPGTGDNITDQKIIEIKLTWSEGGKTRELIRQAVVRR